MKSNRASNKTQIKNSLFVSISKKSLKLFENPNCKRKKQKGLSLCLSLCHITWESERCREGWHFRARFRWVVGCGPSQWWVAQPGSGRWCRRSTSPCQCYEGSSWTWRRLQRRRAWHGWWWTTRIRCSWPWIWGNVFFPCLGSLAFSLETKNGADGERDRQISLSAGPHGGPRSHSFLWFVEGGVGGVVHRCDSNSLSLSLSLSLFELWLSFVCCFAFYIVYFINFY